MPDSGASPLNNRCRICLQVLLLLQTYDLPLQILTLHYALRIHCLNFCINCFVANHTIWWQITVHHDFKKPALAAPCMALVSVMKYGEMYPLSIFIPCQARQFNLHASLNLIESLFRDPPRRTSTISSSWSRVLP